MELTRLIVTKPDGTVVGEVDPTRLVDASATSEVNGEHSLTLTTLDEYAKGDRILWRDARGIWHEHVVNACDASHEGGGTVYEHYCVWSLQYDLAQTFVTAMPGTGGTPATARGALEAALGGTERWGVGTVDVLSTGSASMWRVSGWDAIGTLVKVWGGEVDATIEVGLTGVVSRSVDLLAHVGTTDVTRRFDFGHDVSGIKRTVLDDRWTARVIPLGKGEETDAGGYGRKITIESVNGGVLWLENAATVPLVRLPSDDGYEIPVQVVENGDIESPQALKDWALAHLDEWTTPKVSYELDVLQTTQAGTGAQGVSLGDEVYVVDRAFGGDGLALAARVVRVEESLVDPSQVTVTISNVRDGLGRQLGSLAGAVSSLSDAVAAQNEYQASAAYMAALVGRLNDEINATGGYTYITEGEGLRTYDRPVSDPLVGAEATKVVEVKGGTIRIADSRTSSGDWDWTNVFTADGINSQLVRAVQIEAGYIGDLAGSGNFWDLDTGEFRLASTASIGGRTVQDVLDDVDATITNVDVQYAQNQSATTAPTSGWSTTAPAWRDGWYIWQRTATTTPEGVDYSTPVMISGRDGSNGVGISSTEVSYGTSASASTQPSSWSTTAPTSIASGTWLWVRNVTTYTDGSSRTAYAKAYQGENGADGSNGNGISSTTICYGTSSSAATQPSSWSSSAPTSIAAGTWLWTRTVTSYTDGTSTTAYSKSYVGTNGEDGTSVTIKGSYDTYAQLVAAHPTGQDGDAYMVGADLYVWNGSAWEDVGQIQGPAGADGINGTDGTDGTDGSQIWTATANPTTPNYTFAIANLTGPTGVTPRVGDIVVRSYYRYTITSVGATTVLTGTRTSIRGAAGTSVTVTSIEYGTSANATTEPTSWSTTAPTALAKGSWLWVRTTYSDGGNATTKSYVGTDGEDGASIYVQSATKTGGVTTVVIADTDGHTNTLTIDDGADGATGTPGTNGLNGYVHVAWATSADGSQGFSTTVSTGKTYLGTYTDNVAADSQDYRDYSWSLIKGADGAQGIPGTDGTSSYVHVAWANSQDGTQDFSTTVSAGKSFLGVYTDEQEDDSTNPADYSWSRIEGPAGEDGVGIASIVEQYYLSTSSSTQSGGSWVTTPPAYVAGRYYWTRSVITWDDGTVTITSAVLSRGLNSANSTATQAKSEAEAAQAQLDVLDTQQGVFNKLTNNGALQGLYMQDGQLYVNGSYIHGGTIVAGGANNVNGIIQVKDASGNVISQLDNSGATIIGDVTMKNDTTLYVDGGNPPVGSTSNVGVYQVTTNDMASHLRYWLNSNTSSRPVNVVGVVVHGTMNRADGDTIYIIPYGNKSINNTGSDQGGSHSTIATDGALTVIAGIEKSFVPALNLRRDNAQLTYGNGAGNYVSGNNTVEVNASGVKIDTADTVTIGRTYTSSATGATRINNFAATVDIGNGTSSATNVKGTLNVARKATIYSLDVTNFSASNVKSRVVATDDYDRRMLYAYETAAPMFGDVGSARIGEDGLCYVEIDDVFSETARTDFGYQVFLQKCGAGDLWVSEKHPGHFVVEGTPGLAFDWEVKARQRNTDGLRLESYAISDAEGDELARAAGTADDAEHWYDGDVDGAASAAGAIEDLYEPYEDQFYRIYGEDLAA